MKKQDKCRIAHCRADSDITLADGTGLCWKHWDSHCENRNDQPTPDPPTVTCTSDPDVSSKNSSSTIKKNILDQQETEHMTNKKGFVVDKLENAKFVGIKP